MDRKNFISMVRNYLYDTSEMVWKDDELSQMIDKAVKAYSEDTIFFHSIAAFVPDTDGRYHYPDDFICFNAGWNSEGIQIKASSEKELEYFFSDPLDMNGVPSFIYDDISDRRKFRLCPDPAAIQDAQHIIFDYGIREDDDYGTENSSGKYGVVLSVTSFQFVGDMMYSRYADFEEIKDYTALIYHVLFQAFDTDSEFSSPDKAAYYKEMYKKRVAMFNQVKNKNNGSTFVNKFF